MCRSKGVVRLGRRNGGRSKSGGGGAFLPFRKLITLPHFPASKGCSFSRPMKVML